MQVEWIGAAAENFRRGWPANFVAQAIVVHIIVWKPSASADEHFNDPQGLSFRALRGWQRRADPSVRA